MREDLGAIAQFRDGIIQKAVEMAMSDPPRNEFPSEGRGFSPSEVPSFRGLAFGVLRQPHFPEGDPKQSIICRFPSAFISSALEPYRDKNGTSPPNDKMAMSI
jgi:hypothetical protein